MKLSSRFKLAIYSAECCTLVAPANYTRLFQPSVSDNALPDATKLASIQQTLSADTLEKAGRCIVVVPDAWLSVSEHRIEDRISPALRPLAALSFATETTFSAPDSLFYCYQYQEVDQGAAVLTVFACSSEWVERLLAPFKRRTQACLLVPRSRCNQVAQNGLSWSRCSQYSLSVYQPEAEQRKHARRLWMGLIGLSLLLNGTAFLYYAHLEGRVSEMVSRYQEKRAAQQEWRSMLNSDDFVYSVLSLVQGLPDSVRLGHFIAETPSTHLHMTLPQQELDRLLTQWRRRYPDWHWELDQQPHQATSLSHQKEVVDAFIKIHQK
ncbi:MAG: hypothetical protein NWP51_08870 [Marinomonas hwangdonensis]|nr:hypothetical protein [Marinomonas hwangdonensis]